MVPPQDFAALQQLLGFPDGTAFHLLTASDAGGCIIVKVHVSGEPLPSQRLFIRRFEEPTYREIAWPAECNSFGDPVIFATKPEVYVLGEHWQNHGGGSVGLYRVTLPGGKAELFHPGRGTHSAGTEDEGGWWFADLLGPTSDEKGLVVSLATSFRERVGSRVEHAVAAFDFDTGHIRQLAPLPAALA
jgi:hypothetical protein